MARAGLHRLCTWPGSVWSTWCMRSMGACVHGQRPHSEIPVADLHHMDHSPIPRKLRFSRPFLENLHHVHRVHHVHHRFSRQT
jgi:hypothetical protein